MDWRQRRRSWPLERKSFDPATCLCIGRGAQQSFPPLHPWTWNQTVSRGVKRSEERATGAFRLAIHIGERNTEMPIHQTPSQRKTVERVMHEFKHGELKTARGRRKVKNPKQAIAIALSEAGASKYDSPKERRHNFRRTKTKERRGETAQAAAEGRRSSHSPSGEGKTRDELYREARRRDIPGRSKMNKQQLERALHD